MLSSHSFCPLRFLATVFNPILGSLQSCPDGHIHNASAQYTLIEQSLIQQLKRTVCTNLVVSFAVQYIPVSSAYTHNMCFYHTMILLYSITKQQQQQHGNDHIQTKSLPTSSKDHSIAIDPVNCVFTNNVIITNEDTGQKYEAVDTLTRQTISKSFNPLYAETEYN